MLYPLHLRSWMSSCLCTRSLDTANHLWLVPGWLESSSCGIWCDRQSWHNGFGHGQSPVIGLGSMFLSGGWVIFLVRVLLPVVLLWGISCLPCVFYFVFVSGRSFFVAMGFVAFFLLLFSSGSACRVTKVLIRSRSSWTSRQIQALSSIGSSEANSNLPNW